jgi:uncharacterized protein YaiE (UPF0345 family)
MTNLNIELKNDYMHGSSKTWLLQNYHSTLKHYDLLEIHKATIAISLINIMIIIKSSFKNKINDVQSWTEFRYWNGASIQVHVNILVLDSDFETQLPGFHLQISYILRHLNKK